MRSPKETTGRVDGEGERSLKAWGGGGEAEGWRVTPSVFWTGFTHIEQRGGGTSHYWADRIHFDVWINWDLFGPLNRLVEILQVWTLPPPAGTERKTSSQIPLQHLLITEIALRPPNLQLQSPEQPSKETFVCAQTSKRRACNYALTLIIGSCCCLTEEQRERGGFSPRPEIKEGGRGSVNRAGAGLNSSGPDQGFVCLRWLNWSYRTHWRRDQEQNQRSSWPRESPSGCIMCSSCRAHSPPPCSSCSCSPSRCGASTPRPWSTPASGVSAAARRRRCRRRSWTSWACRGGPGPTRRSGRPHPRRSSCWICTTPCRPTTRTRLTALDRARGGSERRCRSATRRCRPSARTRRRWGRWSARPTPWWASSTSVRTAGKRGKLIKMLVIYRSVYGKCT